jgi:dipeptidyl aminopeptidase/acylaminoacyl peptidase
LESGQNPADAATLWRAATLRRAALARFPALRDDRGMSEPLTFDRFLALPRLSALKLSPDGERLVVAVSRLGPEGKEMKTALWQVDPAGAVKPRRITRSAAGESVGCFLRDGSLLFTSARPDPDAKPDPDKKINALWLLPAEGGEARMLLAPDGGVEAVTAALTADTIAFGASLHPEAKDLADDAERAKARKEAGVGALLFDSYPIRYWDEWLAPRSRRLFATQLAGGGAAAGAGDADPEAKLEPRDLTGNTGPVALVESGIDLSPDGRTLYTRWTDYSASPMITEELIAIDVETGERRQLTHGGAWFANPKASPDGKFLACLRGTYGAPDDASDVTLWLIDLATGEGRDLTPELDLWPETIVWAHDSAAVFVTADRLGGVAPIRVDLADGKTTVLVSDGAVSELCPTPDGKTIYALQSTMSHPARIVRFDARTADQSAVELPNGISEGGIAARSVVERLTAKAADGTTISSWLVLPPEASAMTPAPLVVWVHGGPLGSWGGWHWRWNPHLLTERGYAVLMPDPAISLGYGQNMVRRGWGNWGAAPYTDVMAATDAALGRPDLDSARTSLMGGSFGGYMANWVAGQTDRFKAIVTHASLWDLRPFHGTTDSGVFWEREIGDPYRQPELYEMQSPAVNVASIKTPMLVIHGEQDFRVPVSEALKLWTDLHRHGVEARFLYFPDENHWILKPQNARIWYETLLAFLDEHVLDKEWVRPALL